jgi:hypothetical protein
MDYLKKYSCYRQNSLRDSMLSDSKSEEHRVKHKSGRYYYVPSLPNEIQSVVFPSSRRFCSEREKQTTSRDEGRSYNIALHHLHTRVGCSRLSSRRSHDSHGSWSTFCNTSRPRSRGTAVPYFVADTEFLGTYWLKIRVKGTSFLFWYFRR